MDQICINMSQCLKQILTYLAYNTRAGNKFIIPEVWVFNWHYSFKHVTSIEL